MSVDSIAALRKSLGNELGALAEQHIQHDLQQSDRDALDKAAKTVSMHTTIGSAVGVGLGILLAFRIRSGRRQMFQAFRTVEKPSAVRFADGREEALPDLTGLLRPSTLGDFATYTFLGLGGLFIGGETGLLTGSFRARQQIAGDRESGDRIRNAFHKFQADALRKQADQLDKQSGSSWI